MGRVLMFNVFGLGNWELGELDLEGGLTAFFFMSMGFKVGMIVPICFCCLSRCLHDFLGVYRTRKGQCWSICA